MEFETVYLKEGVWRTHKGERRGHSKRLVLSEKNFKEDIYGRKISEHIKE